MSGVQHRVLVLGSGFTSGPLVEYLTRDGSVAVTVGGWTSVMAKCKERHQKSD